MGLAKEGYSINLDPKKKGTFTKFCKSKDYSGVTDACIKEGKESKNPLTRKRAVFAENAQSFKHPKKNK